MLPEGTGLQVPTLPARLQASHAPVQAELQHTQSMHWLEPHSLAALQAAPWAFLGTQAPLEQ